MTENYYFILGVPANSSQTDIKAAYRRRAKELHPDQYGANQTPFQVLHEAYSVLSNPTSRQSYDDSLQDTVRIDQPRHKESGRQYCEDIIEPLIPEENLQSINRNSPDESFYYHWSPFDSLYDPFSGHFAARKEAYRRFLVRLRVVI